MPESGEMEKPRLYGNSLPEDAQIRNRIDKLVTDANLTVSEILDTFPVYVRRVDMARFLAHYELFKMIADLPGHIVECGVFRGTSLFSFAKFMEIFNAGDRARKIYGFDTFTGFERIHEKDGKTDQSAGRVAGGWSPEAYYEELKEHVNIFHADSYLPRSLRIFLHKGDISVIAPKFMEENPGIRISLLHLDVDVYEPTLAALKAFYPSVVHGGVVVLDEYALNTWPGESAAVEDYFGDKMPRIRKFPFSTLPGGYFIKE